ncbi:DUF2232 domain-containing protein, partial [Intestinibacter sp.]
KKLTLASILTSLCIVITIFVMSTGIGYGIYLDFAVPIFFAMVYLKCGGKYSILSGIISVLLVFMVIGNLVGALFMSQSFLLGIVCAYFMNKDSVLMEDIFFSGIFSVILVMVIDLYTKALSGTSIITEFQEIADWMPYKESINLTLHILIAFYCSGLCFCIYYLSLFLGKRLNILTKNAQKKYYIFRNLKLFNRFLCLRRNTFYLCSIYIIAIEMLNLLNFNIKFVYLRVILICVEYIAYYYIFRDSLIIIKDFLITYTKKSLYIRLFTLSCIALLFVSFRIEIIVLALVSFAIDLKNDIRPKQKTIVDLYYERMHSNIRPQH